MATRGGGPPPDMSRGRAPSMPPAGMRGGGPVGAAPGGGLVPARGRGMPMPPGAHLVKAPMGGPPGAGGAPGGSGAAVSMGAVRGGAGGVPPPGFPGKVPVGMPGGKVLMMPPPHMQQQQQQQQQRVVSPSIAPSSAGAQRGSLASSMLQSRSSSPGAPQQQPYPPQFAFVNGKKIMVPPGTKLSMGGGPPQPPGMPMGIPGAKVKMMVPPPSQGATPGAGGAGPGSSGPSRGPSPMPTHPAPGPSQKQAPPPPPQAAASPPPQQQQQQPAEPQHHENVFERGIREALSFLRIDSDSDDEDSNNGHQRHGADASARQGPSSAPAARGPGTIEPASMSDVGPLPSPMRPQQQQQQQQVQPRANTPHPPMMAGMKKVMVMPPGPGQSPPGSVRPSRSGSVGGDPSPHPPNAFPPGKVLVKKGPPPPSVQQPQQPGIMAGGAKVFMVPASAAAEGGSAGPSRSSSAEAGTRVNGPTSRSNSITLLSPPGHAQMPPSLPQQLQQHPSSPMGTHMVKRPVGPPQQLGASSTSTRQSPLGAASASNAVRVPSSTVLKGEALPEAGVRASGRGRRRPGESSEDSDEEPNGAAAAAAVSSARAMFNHLRLSPSDDSASGDDERVADADALSDAMERPDDAALSHHSAYSGHGKESTRSESSPSTPPPLAATARLATKDTSSAAQNGQPSPTRPAAGASKAATGASHTTLAPVRQTATAAARAAAAAAKRRQEEAEKAKYAAPSRSRDKVPKQQQQQQQQHPLSPQEDNTTHRPSSNGLGSHSITSSRTPSRLASSTPSHPPSEGHAGRQGGVRSPTPPAHQQEHFHSSHHSDYPDDKDTDDVESRRQRQQIAPQSASTASSTRRRGEDHATRDHNGADARHGDGDGRRRSQTGHGGAAGPNRSPSAHHDTPQQPQRHQPNSKKRDTADSADADVVNSAGDVESRDSDSEYLTSRDLYRLVKVLRDANADVDAEEHRYGRQHRHPSAGGRPRSGLRSSERRRDDDIVASDRDGAEDGEGSDAWGLRDRRQRSALPASTLGLLWRHAGTRRTSSPFATPPPVRRPLGYINVGGGHYARVGGSPYARPRGRPQQQPVGAVPLDTSNISRRSPGVGGVGRSSSRGPGFRVSDEATAATPRVLSPPRRDPETSALVDARHNAVVAELQANAVLQSSGNRHASSVHGEDGGHGNDSPAAAFYRAMHRVPYGRDTSPVASPPGQAAEAAPQPTRAALDATLTSIAESQHPYCAPASALLPVLRGLSPVRGGGNLGGRYANGAGAGAGGGDGATWPPSSAPPSSLQAHHPQQTYQIPTPSRQRPSLRSESATNAAAAAAPVVQEPTLLMSPPREADAAEHAGERSTVSEAGTRASAVQPTAGSGDGVRETRDPFAMLRRSSFFDLLYDSPIRAPSPRSAGRSCTMTRHHQKHQRSAAEPAKLIPDTAASLAARAVADRSPPRAPTTPFASDSHPPATQRSVRVTQRSQSARSRVSNVSSKGRANSAAAAAPPPPPVAAHCRPHSANPDPYRPPARTKEPVYLTRATIARLSTPQQRRSNSAAAAAAAALSHQQHGEAASNATAQTCSKWLDEILASTTITAAGVRAGGATGGDGGGGGVEGPAAEPIPVIDLRREFKPRVSDGVGVGGGGGPVSAQAAALSLREFQPAADYTRDFTGSRARPHTRGLSFKHMVGARSATGSPVREAKPQAAVENGVVARMVGGVPDGLPFHLYSSIRMHDPTRKSPWALAPEREGLDVLPGQPALSRRRRIPLTAGGHAVEHHDDDDDDGMGSRRGGGGNRDGPSLTIVEEVHLDENRQPYLVVRPVPSAAQVEAQRAAVERLARPKPLYRRAEESSS